MEKLNQSISREDSIEITPDILDILNRAIECAINYETIFRNKRKLGITGEVGEILACHKYRLQLVLNSQSAGYDAIDKNGNRIQIKTRKSESGEKLRDLTRLSRFSRHEFDYCLLLLLDRNYQIYEIWKADYEKLLPLIEKEKNRNPSLGLFKKVGVREFAKD